MHVVLQKRFWKFFLVVLLVGVGMFLVARAAYSLKQRRYEPIRYGITFSTLYASYLGLDPLKTYQDLVENMGVRAVRFPVYWSEIEPTPGQFTWGALDTFIKYSEDHHVKLTVALGRKVPRWPECFVPNWAEKQTEDDQQKAVLRMMHEVIVRYKDSSAIERWQLENEPLLPFGVCPTVREKDLREEVSFVRSLDHRPIQITASGEMEPWGLSAALSDVLGISVYRVTWNRVFGYFTYPLSPLFYRLRALPFWMRHQMIIVSELQAEPWFSEDVKKQPVSYWYSHFSEKDLDDNIQFVQEMHVSEAYLWGAEWWVYLKQHGEDRLWNKAKQLFIDTH